MYAKYLLSFLLRTIIQLAIFITLMLYQKTIKTPFVQKMHESYGQSNYCQTRPDQCALRPYKRVFIYYTDGVGKLFSDLSMDQEMGDDFVSIGLVKQQAADSGPVYYTLLSGKRACDYDFNFINKDSFFYQFKEKCDFYHYDDVKEQISDQEYIKYNKQYLLTDIVSQSFISYQKDLNRALDKQEEVNDNKKINFQKYQHQQNQLQKKNKQIREYLVKNIQELKEYYLYKLKKYIQILSQRKKDLKNDIEIFLKKNQNFFIYDGKIDDLAHLVTMQSKLYIRAVAKIFANYKVFIQIASQIDLSFLFSNVTDHGTVRSPYTQEVFNHSERDSVINNRQYMTLYAKDIQKYINKDQLQNNESQLVQLNADQFIRVVSSLLQGVNTPLTFELGLGIYKESLQEKVIAEYKQGVRFIVNLNQLKLKDIEKDLSKIVPQISQEKLQKIVKQIKQNITEQFANRNKAYKFMPVILFVFVIVFYIAFNICSKKRLMDTLIYNIGIIIFILYVFKNQNLSNQNINIFVQLNLLFNMILILISKLLNKQESVQVKVVLCFVLLAYFNQQLFKIFDQYFYDAKNIYMQIVSYVLLAIVLRKMKSDNQMNVFQMLNFIMTIQNIIYDIIYCFTQGFNENIIQVIIKRIFLVLLIINLIGIILNKENSQPYYYLAIILNFAYFIFPSFVRLQIILLGIFFIKQLQVLQKKIGLKNKVKTLKSYKEILYNLYLYLSFVLFFISGLEFSPANNTWLFKKFDIICLYKNIFFTAFFFLILLFNIVQKNNKEIPVWKDQMTEIWIGFVFLLAIVGYQSDEKLVSLKLIEFVGVSFFLIKGIQLLYLIKHFVRVKKEVISIEN